MRTHLLVAVLVFIAGAVFGQLGLKLSASMLWILLGSGTFLWGWATWREHRETENRE